MHNLDTMYYNICHVTQQVLYNIQELNKMALPSAMSIAMVFHLPHILFCLISHNRIEHIFLRPDKTLLKTWEKLVFKQQNSIIENFEN